MKQRAELPETLTIAAYKDWRRDALLDCLAAVGAALLRGCFPVLIICEAIREFNDSNAAVRGMTFLFIIPGMLLLLQWILRKMVCRISDNLKEITTAREVCLRSISDEDARAWKKKRTLKTVCAGICVGALLAVVIGNAAARAAKTRAIYRQGVAQIAAGEYEQAIETLEPLEKAGHQGARRQTYLAMAYKKYEEGNLSGAYGYVEQAWDAGLEKDADPSIRAFCHTVCEEYNTRAEEVQAQNREAEERRITEGVPFVGMSESRIEDTSLGKPSSMVRHDIAFLDGKQYTTNIYDFYQNLTCIFIARCARGRVIEVWDHPEPEPEQPSHKVSSATNPAWDPDTDGFTNPEDFYDWYYDEFFSYEDAEDYYNEHS